jgi:metallo-beta-lactamase class B
VGGTRALVELTGAETFLGRGDIEILESRPELTWAGHCGFEFHEAFRVDRPLDGGETVALGGLSVECVATPGHTPGAVSYFFEVFEGGTRWRVGTHGGPGLNTLTRVYLEGHGLPPERRGAYLDSLARLKERAVDLFVGIHPNQSGTLERRARMDAGPNPFVDPAAWPAFLEGLEQRARAAFSAD